MSVTIELDFTGVNPAGSGLGYLTTGMHEAKIVEFKHYEDSNRLYCYFLTNGIRHRDSFSLSDKALPFLMAFLVSTGVSEDKLRGKVNMPFDKLVGKTAYVNYTAPTMGANGQPVEGSYPDYRYLNQAHYDSMQKAMAASAPASFQVEETKAAPAATQKVNEAAVAGSAAPQASDDDFDFLLE